MRLWLFLLPLGAAAEVLDVTLIDYAGVPPKVMATAREVFLDIYRKAGGRVRLTVQTKEWRPDESIKLSDVPGDIVLRICSKEMGQRLTRKSTLLGYVQPTGEGEIARVASVFYQRAEELQEATGDLTSHVLGAALAHELGHLLLGKGQHSPMGLMRCPWDAEDLRALRRGQLVFDMRQARMVGDGIRARTGRTSSAAARRR